jgi:hypothetical protein
VRDPARAGLADAGVYADDAVELVDLLRALPRPPTAEAVEVLLSELPRAAGSARGDMVHALDAGDLGRVWVRTDRALSVLESQGHLGRVLGSEMVVEYPHPPRVLDRMEELSSGESPPDWARRFVTRSSSHGRIARRARDSGRAWINVADRVYAAADGALFGTVKPSAARLRRLTFPLDARDPAAGTVLVEALAEPTAIEQADLREHAARVMRRRPDEVDLASVALRRQFWVHVTIPVSDDRTLVVSRGYTESHQSYGILWRQVFDPQNTASEIRRQLEFARAVSDREPPRRSQVSP